MSSVNLVERNSALVKVSYLTNIGLTLATILTGGALKIFRGNTQKRTIESHMGAEIGVFLIVVSLASTFLCTATLFLIRDTRRVILNFEIIIIAMSAIFKIVFVVHPGSMAWVFKRDSLFITDFNNLDVQLDPNNKILLPSDTFANSWALTQIKMKCCGLSGPNDYKVLKFKKNRKTGSSVPLSCCSFEVDVFESVGQQIFDECATDEDKIYQDGCFAPIWRSLNPYSKFAYLLLMLLACTEIMMMYAAWKIIDTHLE